MATGRTDGHSAFRPLRSAPDRITEFLGSLLAASDLSPGLACS
jgi:hypothetical protein